MDISFYIIGIVLILVIIVVYKQIKRSKCPLCGKYKAIKVSGQTNLEKYTKREKEYIPEKRMTKNWEIIYQKYITHYKCKYCSHTFDERGECLVDKKSY